MESRASFRVFNFISGQVITKYCNRLRVGLSVERRSNSQQVFLGTPSFIAKLDQLDNTREVTSRANAISSKSPAVGKGAWIFRDVIMSFTFSESMHPAKREEYTSHVLALFRFLALRLFHIICHHFDRDGRTVMPVIKPGPTRGKFENLFVLNGWNLGENLNLTV